MAKIGIEVLTKIDDARSDLRKLDASVESVDKTVKDMAGSMKSAENSLSGFSGATANIANIMSAATNAIDMTQQIVGVLKGAFDETIGAAAEWGDSMGDLAALTNQSVEETSRLAATMELLGIDSSNLGRIMKSMTKEGLNLNLETLLKLNKQYNAIQDPVEKNAFLFKNFGKAAEDMAEVMGRSEAELAKLADTAAKSGKVIGEDAAEAAETLNLQMAILNQKIEGAKINLGTAGIQAGTVFAPAIRDANNEVIKFIGNLAEANSPMALFAQFIAQGALVRDFANALDIQSKKTDEVTEATDDGERAAKAWAARWAGIAKEALAQKTMTEAKEAAAELRDELAILNAAMGGEWTKEQESFYGSQKELSERAKEVKARLEELNATHGQYYQVTTNSGISANELALAQLELAQANEELNKETDPEKQLRLRIQIDKLQETISGASTTVEGYIDNSEEIGELSTEWDEITAALERNRQAHRENEAQIIFSMAQQKYAVDGFTDAEIAALTDIGEGLGIYDTKTAEVMRSVQDSIDEHGTKANEVLTDLYNKYEELRLAPDIEKSINIRTYMQAVELPKVQYGSEDPGAPVIITPDGGGGGGLEGAESIQLETPDPGSNTGSSNASGQGPINVYVYANSASATEVAEKVLELAGDRARLYTMAGV